jgi:hypothetical protein
MVLAIWHPPTRKLPSTSNLGEESPSILHDAVGRALSRWEHLDSECIKLFQLFCETPRFAACRAYGTILGARARADALEAAAEVFFEKRDQAELSDVLSVLRAYKVASTYRNNIAHGIAVQPHEHRYFLCPPSYVQKKFEYPHPKKWALAAAYFYKVKDIDSCAARFEAIREEIAMTVARLNRKYRVLQPSDFHP